MDSLGDQNGSKYNWSITAKLKRCLLELLTSVLFLAVFVLGLSLMAAGVFKEQVHIEAEAKAQFKLDSVKLPAGSVMVLYSLIGLVVEFKNKLHGKVSSH